MCNRRWFNEMLERSWAEATRHDRPLACVMIDLDGLKLLELGNVELTPEGELVNAAELVAQLRRAKPWLFSGTSSSSPSNQPPAHPLRPKLATEMTDEEYHAARIALLKHQS